MSEQSPMVLTDLLQAWSQGDRQAQEALWPIVYRELKDLARGVLRRRAGRRHLGTTTLLHEAYLRLAGSPLHLRDREHFYAVAARTMRFVLVDHARRRLADKRKAEDSQAELPDEPATLQGLQPEEVLAVHDALGRLGQIQPQYERLVEMRYFAGFSVDETANLLAISRPTAVRHWRAARTWLYHELQAGGASGSSLGSPNPS